MKIEIRDSDFECLLSAIRYVIGRKGDVVDSDMVLYLEESMKTVKYHVENERFGGSGESGKKATQIEAILAYLEK